MPAYYATTVRDFLDDSPSEIFASLVQANERSSFLRLEHAQTRVWDDDITLLRSCFAQLLSRDQAVFDWGILLEFPIPRRQKRADVIVLARDVIFVLEFKAETADRAAYDQVEDYALDLSDFHGASRDSLLFPIVVAPRSTLPPEGSDGGQNVQPVRWCAPIELADLLVDIYQRFSNPSAPALDLHQWNTAAYKPVPTMIEAALAIFSGMEVREIAHAHCEPHNLTTTVDTLVDVVDHAHRNCERAICFVTGVPGSGKTLAGLRAVHDHRLQTKDIEPSFLSGNGPLVRILREALARDFKYRTGLARKTIDRRVQTLIENVHVFARTYWDDSEERAPNNRVIVFDEAQRAWNAARNQRKFKRDVSEPEMILRIMSRHDWCVIVALVGGGQEINDGEAGLGEWGRALTRSFPKWRVYASPEAIEGGESVANAKLFESSQVVNPVVSNGCLHLDVSTRSYRALAITEWSNALLRGDVLRARSVLEKAVDFPVFVTRDLAEAKKWLLRKSRGTARCGLVASSGAARLRAHGLETSTSFHRDYPYQYWFLNDREDVRSSYQMEVAATEFEIQGLELDWIGLCWGGDLLWDKKHTEWRTLGFRGTKWAKVKGVQDREYLLNSYRVLLTRARQGMVIWVPNGDIEDPTRPPQPLTDTADMLCSSGLHCLRKAAGDRT